MRELELAGWRRSISELYAAARAREPRPAWELWCRERQRLFLTHPQTPLPPDRRDAAHVPAYFPYDPEWRRSGRVEPAERTAVSLPASAGVETQAERFATVHMDGLPSLALYWLRDYAGGLFLSFRDAGAGGSTYGGGRYLLDTAKGADLGVEGDELVLDFHFAYQPSCSYDPRWECPLPPRENWLDVAVEAGERYR